MGLDRLLRKAQDTEREGIRWAAEYLGEENIADVERKIQRPDRQHHTDFDIVTKDGAVCEVFGSRKKYKDYQPQLARIATSIEWLKEIGEDYSGRFVIFYHGDSNRGALSSYAEHLQYQHQNLDIEVAFHDKD